MREREKRRRGVKVMYERKERKQREESTTKKRRRKYKKNYDEDVSIKSDCGRKERHGKQRRTR